MYASISNAPELTLLLDERLLDLSSNISNKSSSSDDGDLTLVKEALLVLVDRSLERLDASPDIVNVFSILFSWSSSLIASQRERDQILTVGHPSHPR